MNEKQLRGEAGEAPGLKATAVASDRDIDTLLQSRDQLEDALRKHRTQLAILFTDIVGSTSFFERYGDTAGLIMLHRHDMLVMPAIEEVGGTVIKTIGDAVLATFPEAKQAVDAAVKIQQRLEEFNAQQPDEDKIYVRVGINYGTGTIKDKDVFGDAVNVAARFVKSCGPAQILVSRSVYASLKDDHTTTVRQIGSANFHGKSAKEEIYEVLWTSPEKYAELRRHLETGEAVPTGRSALGRYELLEELGRGAMGVVHKAFDPAVGRIVALKTVRLDVPEQEREELVQRLRREAQAAGRLEHPNIVTIYDAGEAEGLFYIAMQFVKGKTLGEVLSERKLLPLNELLPLAEQLCSGLHCAHENGIVHRDLKPNNVIVTPEGIPKIVDFGVAKIAESGTTRAGMIIGTPSYMSPEQAQGGRVDRRSDIFSFGSILYELLGGEKPFPGNTPTAIIYKILHEDPIPLRAVERSVPPALERVVHKALAKNPFDRYETCQDLLDDLQAAASGEFKSALSGPLKRAKTHEVSMVAPADAENIDKRKIALWSAAAVLLVVLSALTWQTGWIGALHGMIFHPASSEVAASPSVEPAIPASAGALPGSAGADLPKTDSQQPVVDQTQQDQPAAPPVANLQNTAASETTKLESSQPEPPTRAAAVKKAAPAPVRPRTLTPQQRREADAWFRQAREYIGRGLYREAAIALGKTLEIDPSHREAREALERARKEIARRNAAGQD